MVSRAVKGKKKKKSVKVALRYYKIHLCEVEFVFRVYTIKLVCYDPRKWL